MRIAVLSDIHGNAWALDAVLDEMEHVRVDRVLNLGDCFHGPLDPRGTYERLEARDWPTVRGNQDRALVQGAKDPTGRFTHEQLGNEGVAWLAVHTRELVRLDTIVACHGDLGHDDVTLLERVEPTHVRLATDAELTVALEDAGPDTDLVLCGHSHQPGTVRLGDGRLVVNPGSVGLPAYQDDNPLPHGMEAGTPHARWALVERTDAGWRIEARATPYDTAAAVAAARAHDRPDWADWITSGRAAR
jgi:putative phosphoesterase